MYLALATVFSRFNFELVDTDVSDAAGSRFLFAGAEAGFEGC